MFFRPSDFRPIPIPPPESYAAKLKKRREGILKAALLGGAAYEDAKKAADNEYPSDKIEKAKAEDKERMKIWMEAEKNRIRQNPPKTVTFPWLEKEEGEK